MGKRKLSKQQQSRIEQNQRRELLDNEQSIEDQNSANQIEDPAEKCNGRIVSHYGQQLDVETLGDGGSRVVRCKQRANLPSLVTGDLVVWEQDESHSGVGVIVARAPRSNVFGRHDAKGQLKPVAANIDLVLLLIASEPIPHLNLIDRYLVAIENLNLKPMLILNKTDLLNEDNQESLDNILSIYEKIGYRPHRVSALTDSGISALKADLQGLTTVLVGQSGVGKSSLLNRLAGGELAAVGELSEAHQQGTHTTTTSRLFHLDNFDLIDSPGIREFSLDFVSPESVFDGFIEFQPYRGLCKFRDCGHRSEPGCAIIQAVEEGSIGLSRLESYYRILDSEE